MANAKIRADLSLRATSFEAGLTKAESRIKSFSKTAARLGTVTLVVNAVGFAEATRVVAGFENDMARVNALTSATAEQFAQLSDEAQRLGATTKFSASEAAQGMGFLAQAGFEANKIIAETENVLNLAAAGMLELGRTADIASNIFTPFEQNDPLLTFERVVDTLSQTASSTNTSVEQLGVAMRQVAPVASQLGVSVESTAGALGALGNAGIQAESAGTALRNIFLRLINPTAEVESGIERLGLTIDQLDPNKFSLVQIFEKVAKAGEELGNRSRAAQANVEIFGVRSAAAAAVMAGSVSDIEKFTVANENAAGKTKELARVMANSLDGALKALKSRFQAVLLTLNESDLGDNFENLINKVTDALANFNETDANKLGENLAQGFSIAKASLQPFISLLSGTGKELRTLAGIIVDNKEKMIALGKAASTAYIAFKGFQLARWISQLGKAGAAMSALSFSMRGIGAAAATATKGMVAFGSALTAVTSMARLSALNQIVSANLAAAFTNAGPKILKAVAKLGAAIGGGILAWDLGKYIGKMLDEAFDISGYLADFVNDLRGVVIDQEGFGEVLSLTQALTQAKSLKEEMAAREAIAARIADLTYDLENGIRNGVKATADQVANMERELTLLKNLEKNADKLAQKWKRIDQFESARANAAKSRQEAEQQAWQKIEDAKARVAAVKTTSEEEVALATRISDVISANAEGLAVATGAARAIAGELVAGENNVGTKTAEDISKAKTDAELLMAALRSEAGLNLDFSAPLGELKSVLKAIKDAKIEDDGIEHSVEDITGLLNTLQGFEIDPDIDSASIEKQFQDALNGLTLDDLRYDIERAIKQIGQFAGDVGPNAERLLMDLSAAKEIVESIGFTATFTSKEDIDRASKLRKYAVEYQKATESSGAEALAYANRRLVVEEQIAATQKGELQKEGRSEAAFDLAEAEAKLTETMSDDRAVKEARDRAAIIKELTQNYKVTEAEASDIADKRLAVEREIHNQRIDGAKQELAARLRLLAAEAGESGENADEVKRQQEVERLTKEIMSEQELGFRRAKSIAEEILRLEEKAQAVREAQADAAREAESSAVKTSGILRKAFSTGPVGARQTVGDKESKISIKEFSASGVEGFGSSLGDGFVSRTSSMIKSLETASTRQEAAAKADNKTQEEAAKAATRAAEEASSAASGSGEDKRQAKPLETLVKLMERTAENTANTVTELQSLSEKLGVAGV